jgi:hypothetical protein
MDEDKVKEIHLSALSFETVGVGGKFAASS